MVGEENCFELNNLDDFLEILFKDQSQITKIDKFSVAEMVKKYLEVYEK